MQDNLTTDRQLLAAYLENADSASFAQIVERHGPMVYRVCFRVLGDHHEAEDAAQATFSILLKKAGSIRSRESLGSWLHGVARQTALYSLRSLVNRRRREKEAVMNTTDLESPPDRLPADAALNLLDEALAQLSSNQREAILLRHLEGRSIEEAAALTGCSTGVLSSRTRDGLRKVRKFFSRRGITLSGAVLLSILTAEAKAEVPTTFASFVQTMSEAAAADSAVTEGFGNDAVQELVKGVMKSMKARSITLTITSIAGVLVTLVLIGTTVATNNPDTPASTAAVVTTAEPVPDKGEANAVTATTHQQSADPKTRVFQSDEAMPTAMGGDSMLPKTNPLVLQSIDKGLENLRNSHKPDGSWSWEDHYAVATTALGVLAHMRGNSIPTEAPDADTYRKGKDWLLKAAEGSPTGYLEGSMYEHAFATMAFAEMWRLSPDKVADNRVHKALLAAVDVIVKAQSPAGGWRYQPKPDGGADTSVTGNVVLALDMAREAGIKVPPEVFANALKYAESAYSIELGAFQYIPRKMERELDSFTPLPPLASHSLGLLVAQVCGCSNKSMLRNSFAFATDLPPHVNRSHYYYTHFHTLNATAREGGTLFSEWYPQVRDALISRQNEDGSWGQAHHTGMAIIMLSMPNRVEQVGANQFNGEAQ